jgi:hypothetical protein
MAELRLAGPGRNRNREDRDAGAAPHRGRTRRLRVEALEGRTLLSFVSYLVTSLADTGPGTLRTAINRPTVTLQTYTRSASR